MRRLLHDCAKPLDGFSFGLDPTLIVAALEPHTLLYLALVLIFALKAHLRREDFKLVAQAFNSWRKRRKPLANPLTCAICSRAFILEHLSDLSPRACSGVIGSNDCCPLRYYWCERRDKCNWDVDTSLVFVPSNRHALSGRSIRMRRRWESYNFPFRHPASSLRSLPQWPTPAAQIGAATLLVHEAQRRSRGRPTTGRNVPQSVFHDIYL